MTQHDNNNNNNNNNDHPNTNRINHNSSGNTSKNTQNEVISSSNSTSSTAAATTEVTSSSSSAAAATILFYCNASASAVASIVSRLCTHPLDTIKARIQISHNNHYHARHQQHPPPPPTATVVVRKWSPRPFNYYSTSIHSMFNHTIVYQMWKTEGVLSFYRGLGIVLMGGTPGTMLYLCTYDCIKQQLLSTTTTKPTTTPNYANTNNNNNFIVYFLSGMIAETIACIIYVPVDVIKERMQVQQQQQSPQLPRVAAAAAATTTTGSTMSTLQQQQHRNYFYRNSYDAFQQIICTEGIYNGLYRGYWATLASFGPYSAIYFVLYEYMKQQVHDRYATTNITKSTSMHEKQQQKQKNDASSSLPYYVDIPFHWTVLCTATAGGLASFITSPLDMAKLRLQVQRAGISRSNNNNNRYTTTTTTSPRKYTGMLDCLVTVYRHEGGMTGLFRGAGARVIHFAPAATITMTTYETIRKQLLVWNYSNNSVIT